jgi:flagellin-specific chaperone FliS
MPAASHRPADSSARAPAYGLVQPLSLMLVNGALQHLGHARECIERGVEPQRHLRAATLTIRELPALLGLPAGDSLATNFADLSDYMCRQLGAVDGDAGVATLDDMCDLLREIRCAWVTGPAAAPTLCEAAPLAARI